MKNKMKTKAIYTKLFTVVCGLSIVLSCTTLVAESVDSESPAGKPIEIIAGDYPAWGATSPGEVSGQMTRTVTDPENPLKTQWEVGDKIWAKIRMRGDGHDITLKGHAVWNGIRWNTDNLYWPVEFTGAFMVDADFWYIGNHQPGHDVPFWDTDVLYSWFYSDVQAGASLYLGDFTHCTNRITITGKSLDNLYLSGDGFKKIITDNDYNISYQPLENDEYIPLGNLPATIYLDFGTGSRQLYKKTGENSYTLISDLGFSGTGINYSYTLDLDMEGSVTPGGMNEEQKNKQK